VTAIGPGRLVLVVGPSGAGKDTLLRLAQAACSEDQGIIFPRRVVTREASAAENNRQMSADAFEGAAAQGAFAVTWRAHGHAYGLPRSIDDDIRAGRTVVANVSRTVISALRRAYAHVTVIAITAPAEVLAERIAVRQRGSDGNIAERVARKVDDTDAAPNATIVNVSSAEYHAQELVRIIAGTSWDG
jgi:ribose 1,5-bisphosphokinase